MPEPKKLKPVYVLGFQAVGHVQSEYGTDEDRNFEPLHTFDIALTVDDFDDKEEFYNAYRAIQKASRKKINALLDAGKTDALKPSGK
jgi:hypothetical protein